MCSDMVGAAGSWHVWRPERLQSPQPEKERGLAFLPDQHRLAGPTFQCHSSSVPGAGLTAGGQAGEAPATVQGTDLLPSLSSSGLRWYNTEVKGMDSGALTSTIVSRASYLTSLCLNLLIC